MNLLQTNFISRSNFSCLSKYYTFCFTTQVLYTKTITPQIQEKTNGEIKLPRKTSDTLLSTLKCRVVRNSIKGLSEMVSDKLQHEDLPLMLEINTLYMI